MRLSCVPALLTGGRFLLVMALLWILVPFTHAASLWTDMTYGPYAVGFKTIEKYDFSRTFREKTDFDGQPYTGERARPVQICVWYPAQASEADLPVVYGEYVFTAPEDIRFFETISEVQGRHLQRLFRLLRAVGPLLDVQNTPMKAVQNAAPLAGPFPVIMYHPDIAGGVAENVVMCEYLASQGYVVAAAHPVGAGSVPVTLDYRDLEALVRDKEFALACLRDEPYADHNSLGLLGYAFGGFSALLMRMRNTDVGAVAVIDLPGRSGPAYELVRDHPDFNWSAMWVPCLLVQDSAAAGDDTAFLDSLPYSARHVMACRAMSGEDFTTFGLIVPADSLSESTTERPSGYAPLCGQVRNFFDAYLKKNGQSLAEMTAATGESGPFALTYRPGRERPPTREQFIRLLRAQQIDPALRVYEKLKAADPEGVFFSEAELNNLGYALLQSNRVDDAVRIFKLNAETFPNSPNVWDSYAEGCIANGERDEALRCYRRVLELLPQDTLSDERTREVLRDNAQRALQNPEDDSD